MSETDNQHDVSVVYEYKIEKGHSWSSHFLIEYKNGQKTEYRKCVKCDSCIKSPDSSTENNETIKVMQAAVRKIKRLSSVHDRFITVQTAIRGLSDPPPDSNCKQPKDFLEIVVDNSTRWKSL